MKLIERNPPSGRVDPLSAECNDGRVLAATPPATFLRKRERGNQ